MAAPSQPSFSAFRTVVGFLLGAIVLVWLRTLRVRLVTHPAVDARDSRVFAFFHGQQPALLRAPRRRKTSVLVSLSADGALQRGVLGALGFCVKRGSSSRGGSSGLLAVAREIRNGRDAAFAVDGPRGPREHAKPGAAKAAALGGALLVPVASAAKTAFVFERAWDRFELPLPFSRVAIVAGAPLIPETVCRDPELLTDAIKDARSRALALIGRARDNQNLTGRREVPHSASPNGAPRIF